MILFAVYNIPNRGLSLKGHKPITIAMWSMFRGLLWHCPLRNMLLN